jgi:glycerol-3-phosphate acyltransferase PlsX
MWPTLRGESIVLDVGASASAPTPSSSSTFGDHGRGDGARIVFDIEKPTVGLLNVGVEEIKGLEEVKEAGRMLREASPLPLRLSRLRRGRRHRPGTVDVVVTEGFTGNIALKTAEGTAKQIAHYLREAMSRTLMLQNRLSFRARRLQRAQARRWIRAGVNGGVFLGLNGIVIKSHGGADVDRLRRSDRNRV